MGVRVDPPEVLQNFPGGQLPLVGVKPPEPPRQIQPCASVVLRFTCRPIRNFKSVNPSVIGL